MRNALFLVALFSALPFAACSSSSSGTPSGGSTSGNSDGGGGGSSTCSCSITYNGVSKTLSCGSSGCINGATFTCDASANSTQGGSCTSVSGGSDGGGGGGGGCSLFTCNSSADCGGVAPCFSTGQPGVNYCYEQEGDPADCSSGTSAVTKTTSNGPTTICVPAACSQPQTFLP